jgi:hypothetical protein
MVLTLRIFWLRDSRRTIVKRMRKALLPLVVAAAGTVLAARQQPAAGTGIILGRVVEAGTGAPIRNAQVVLSSREDAATSVLTDGDGRFVFSAVPAGQFMLWAKRSGYSDAMLGQRSPQAPPDEPLTLKDNERRGDVVLRLWKHGAIRGIVRNDAGDPIVGVVVRAFQREHVAGLMTLGSSVRQAATDDRGMYRIGRLVAGEYVVGVPLSIRSLPAVVSDRLAEINRSGTREERIAFNRMLSGVLMAPPGSPGVLRAGDDVVAVDQQGVVAAGGQLTLYPTRYYPDASGTSGAQPISVGAGEQVDNIDLTLRLMRAFRVSGRLIDDGNGVANLPVRLVPENGTPFENEMNSPGSVTLTDDAGRFSLAGAAPGDYVVRVLKGQGGEIGGQFTAVRTTGEGGTVLSRGILEGAAIAPPDPKQNTRFATRRVTVVDEDVVNLTLAIGNGVRLMGRIEFDGAAGAPSPETLRRLHPVVESTDGVVPGFEFERTASIAPDRRFETVGLPPGRYFLRVPNLPAGWWLKSVSREGRDISDEAIDVDDQPLSGIVIQLTDRPSMLSGSVVASSRDERLDIAMLVAFPVDRKAWVGFGNTPRRLVSAPAAQDGRYRLAALPAGDYFVAAVPDDRLGDWRYPAFLDKVASRAIRVSIADGEQKTLSLPLVPVR